MGWMVCVCGRGVGGGINLERFLAHGGLDVDLEDLLDGPDGAVAAVDPLVHDARHACRAAKPRSHGRSRR